MLTVSAGNGVEVAFQGERLLLDPKRGPKRGEDPGHRFVTHGHTDHLTGDAHMTPPTVDFLKLRKPAARAKPLRLGDTVAAGAMKVRFHDAGHVLGSAMTEVETPDGTLLYTGDFNPRESLTTNAAQPRPCDILVTESTYGDPTFGTMPPAPLVLESIETWTLHRLLQGPVALGAYPLGRAQELVHIANRAGITPIVSPDIATFCAVYNAHGHDLHYAVAGTQRARDHDEAQGGLHIVPREWLKQDHDFARGLKSRNGHAAYLSGWCHKYSYFGSYAIDAQFTLSDHATFDELLDFAAATGARRIYTMHGAALPLARELRRRLSVQAEVLQPAPEQRTLVG